MLSMRKFKCFISIISIIIFFITSLSFLAQSDSWNNNEVNFWRNYTYPNFIPDGLSETGLENKDVWRFVVQGDKDVIDCFHKPLNQFGRKDVSFSKPSRGSRFAYVWYLTQAHYFCSALVSLKHLKELRDLNSFPFRVDYVAVLSRDDLAQNHVQELLEIWHSLGGIHLVKPSMRKFLSSPDYKACYQKLYSLMLIQYDRVIAMDADGVIINNLDHLFLLDFPDGVSIAAPQGHWFKNHGIGFVSQETCPDVRRHNKKAKESQAENVLFPLITTIFMVIKPHHDLFERTRKYFGKFRSERNHEFFDQDIINVEYSCQGEVLVLPKVYGTLNNDFKSTNESSCLTLSQVQFLHFSDSGKPWGKKPSDVMEDFSTYPDSLKRFFSQWFSDAHHFCPDLIEDVYQINSIHRFSSFKN